jgi:protein involved in polysaccharide export with SLBB domain
MFGADFLRPGEMQRLSANTLHLPILSSLSGLDEPSEDFAAARPIMAEDLKVDSADYIIGKNDLLSISLQDVNPGVETVKTARVSESGNISLPLVGQVPAAGYTEAQLEKVIGQKYRDQGIVKDAQVSVVVIEARQRTFQIRGAVARPGQYAIVQSDFRVLDAIVLAGDVQIPNIDYLYVIRPPAKNPPASTQPSPTTEPAPRPAVPGAPGLLDPKPRNDRPATRGAGAPAGRTDAGSRAPATGTLEASDRNAKPPVFINGGQAWDPKSDQPAPGGLAAADTATPATGAKDFEFNAPLPQDQSTIIKVPLHELIMGELKYNIVIRPQDTVMVPVPEAGEFYVGGHVQRVGVYSLTGRQITLKQAIISAGMLDEVAVPERTEIVRRIGREREVFVRVNLKMVFQGKQSDIFLKPYDVIQVGTNGLAPFLAAVRNAFRLTYGFGFIYDRNFYLDPSQKAGASRTR